MKQTISVVISAYNEEKKIKDCLESVKWADEIIFIDNESQDKTAEIAKKYTTKVFTRENNLMLNVNKNFGFTKATSEWVLSLDADERVTVELREEIEQMLSKGSQKDGYFIPRKNIIFGKWIEHTGWYPDHQLRLFRRRKGKFQEEHVHEMITVEGETGNLNEHLMHYNYDSISQFVTKTNLIYAPNEAKDLIKKGYSYNSFDAIRFPLAEFTSRFFAREGYKDGMHGLMLSLLMAFYHLIVFANLWEQNKFKEEDKDVIGVLSQEMRKGGKDLKHWFVSEKIKNTQNPFKKIYYAVLHKLSL